MFKIISFFKRRKGLSVGDFRQHWRGPHAELVATLPGVRKYVQNHTLESGYRAKEPDFDGVAEVWFDDREAMRESGASAAYAAVRADEEAFIDTSTLGSLITREVVILDGSPSPQGVKMIAFLNKLPEMAVAEFHEYWSESHGPLAATIPGLERYVQCHTHWGIYDAGRTPLYDGAPMMWFEDLETLRLSSGSPEWAATRADESNFLYPGRLPFIIADEYDIPIDEGLRTV